MSARARIDSMKPHKPGRTRTAPPIMPALYPARGRYLAYILFGSCGFLIYAVAFEVLHTIWVLGNHDPAAWQAHLASHAHPLYLLFHFVSLVAITWFGLRFIGLFPKTQPPRIAGAPRPPDIFFTLALNGAFVVMTIAIVLILGGAFF
jgi:fumarate reductase subunit C